MKPNKKQNKTVVLDADLHKELKILAVRRERELAELLNQAVREFLAKNLGDKTRAKQE